MVYYKGIDSRYTLSCMIKALLALFLQISYLGGLLTYTDAPSNRG